MKNTPRRMIDMDALIRAIRSDPDIDSETFARVKRHIEDIYGIPRISAQTALALLKMGENSHNP